jgi:hypothetical protein
VGLGCRCRCMEGVYKAQLCCAISLVDVARSGTDAGRWTGGRGIFFR